MNLHSICNLRMMTSCDVVNQTNPTFFFWSHLKQLYKLPLKDTVHPISIYRKSVHNPDKILSALVSQYLMKLFMS